MSLESFIPLVRALRTVEMLWSRSKVSHRSSITFSYIKLFSCTVRRRAQSGSSILALLLVLLPSVDGFLFCDSVLCLILVIELIPVTMRWEFVEFCCSATLLEINTESPLFTFPPSPSWPLRGGRGEEGGVAQALSSLRDLRFEVRVPLLLFLPLSGGKRISLINSEVWVGFTIFLREESGKTAGL